MYPFYVSMIRTQELERVMVNKPGPAATFIPARRMGCLIPNISVIGVEIVDILVILRRN